MAGFFVIHANGNRVRPDAKRIPNKLESFIITMRKPAREQGRDTKLEFEVPPLTNVRASAPSRKTLDAAF